MLCLMFECEERGVLVTGGKPWTISEIAGAVGGDQRVTLACIQELCDKRVVAMRENGALYSRRMVLDEELRVKRAKAGSIGGSKTQANRVANHQANSKQITEDEDEVEDVFTKDQEATAEDSARRRKLPELMPAVLDDPLFVTAWSDWLEYKRQAGKSPSPITKRKALDRLAKLGVERAIAMIEYSISNGYDGLHEPKVDRKSGDGERLKARAALARQVDASDRAKQTAAVAEASREEAEEIF